MSDDDEAGGPGLDCEPFKMVRRAAALSFATATLSVNGVKVEGVKRVAYEPKNTEPVKITSEAAKAIGEYHASGTMTVDRLEMGRALTSLFGYNPMSKYGERRWRWKRRNRYPLGRKERKRLQRWCSRRYGIPLREIRVSDRGICAWRRSFAFQMPAYQPSIQMTVGFAKEGGGQ